MGQFYAWAATGQVTRVKSWSDPAVGARGNSAASEDGTMRIATRMRLQQNITLRTKDGRQVAVQLTDSGINIKIGHVVTVVWAASAGSSHGQCVWVQNHTTRAQARLTDNLPLIRPQVHASKVAGFGFLATIPAALVTLTWLMVPGSIDQIDPIVLLAGVTAALAVLFLIGAVVSKLVFDYLRSDDNEKIWTAAGNALAAAHRAELSRAPVT